MTVPDPHAPSPLAPAITRRAAREARERAAAPQGIAGSAPAAPFTASLTRRQLRDQATVGAAVATDAFSPALPAPAPASTPAPTLLLPAVRQEEDHPPIFRPPPARYVLVRRPAPVPEPSLLEGHPLRGRRRSVRHGHRPRRPRLAIALGIAAILVIGGTAGVTSALATGPGLAAQAAAAQSVAAQTEGAQAEGSARVPFAAAPVAVSPSASSLALPKVVPPAATVAPASVSLCAAPAFTAALAAHDDAGAVVAAGGADAFRAAVAGGSAPCVSLADPAHVWVVIDKQRPFDPIDFAPSPRVLPANVRSLEGGTLRTDAAAALTQMVDASRAAGAGDIALLSGYRSFATQHTSYGVQVKSRGVAGADLVSARPGYSEHQSGFAGDLVACTGADCSSIDDLAATPQGAWLKENCWRFGWIVRYEAGQTPITGYAAEPWHLRYIGVPLATAYHDGGFHTLEQFFGLPAAPAYAN